MRIVSHEEKKKLLLYPQFLRWNFWKYRLQEAKIRINKETNE